VVSDLLLYGGFLLTFLILWGAIYTLLPLVRHGHSILAPALARMAARWPGANRYAAIALIVILGAVFTAWAGDGFLDLAEQVHAKSILLQTTDINAHRWAVAHRTSGATGFFVLMSTIGGPAGVGVIAVTAMIALLVHKRYRWLVYLIVTTVGGGLLNIELKRYFERARPDVAEMLRRAQGYSFPSGHAMGSTVVFGALAYLAFRTAVHWKWKTASLALGATMVLAVALSRVYLGAHWISDVAAGIACGGTWVAICTVAYETLRRVRRLRTIPSPGLRPPSPR
jgi:membrane-associated phospholipid phosphatase